MFLRHKIWGSDLADIRLLSKYNKVRLYDCVVLLKDKEDVTISKSFQKILDKSDQKTDKIWVDQGNECCNRLLKSWLHNNGIEM